MRKYDILPLADVAELSSGRVAPQEWKYFRNGIHRFIRVKHFKHLENRIFIGNECDFINDEAVNDKKLKLFEKGTIVFPKSGMAIIKNNMAILKYDSYIVNHLATVVIKDKNKVYEKYLLYYLKNYSIPKLAFDISYPSIRISDIAEIPIVLPSLSQQKIIGDYLHKLDSLIEKRMLMNEKLLELKLSKFLELFGHPYKSRYKSKPIKEISDIKSGFAHKPKISGGIPQLRTYNITDSCSLNLSAFKYVDSDKTETYKIKLGDVLFNNTNSIDLVGKTALYDETGNEYVFSNHITRIRTNAEVSPEYLWGFLSFLYKEMFFRKIAHKWVNQVGIDTNAIGDIKIPIPPLGLQERYSQFIRNANVLDKKQIISLKMMIKLYINKMKEIFSEMMVKASK